MLILTASNAEWTVDNGSDWAIAIAYFSIPVQLMYFLYIFPVALNRLHKSVIALFASFILLCGAGHAFHAMHMLLLHQQQQQTLHPAGSSDPPYPSSVPFRSLALLVLWTKFIAAAVSLLTSFFLYCIIPKVLAHVRYVAELEDGMRRKIVELDEARAVAELANYRKGEFMSFLCHEIRNPLYVITANIDFLLESSNMSAAASCSDEMEMVRARHMMLERESTAASTAESVASADTTQNSTIAMPSPPASNSPRLSTAHSASLLFNIPSLPTSVVHSRSSTLESPLQTDPLIATLSPLMHLVSPMRNANANPTARHAASASASANNTSTSAHMSAVLHNGKRRTWPSTVEPFVGPRLSSQPDVSRSGSLVHTPPAALSLEQRQYLRSINHAAELMVNICNDVLDIAKLESGVIVFEHLAVDLPLLCETFISLSRPQAAAKNIDISLVWDSPQITSRYVFCDPTRLHQIFLQIISNAIKFSSHDEETDNEHDAEHRRRDATNRESSHSGPVTPILSEDHDPERRAASRSIATVGATLTDIFTSAGFSASRTGTAGCPFPPRIASGPGAGGQIQFRVRSYTPTRAELNALGLGTARDEEPMSPRMRELEESARGRTPSPSTEDLPLLHTYGTPVSSSAAMSTSNKEAARQALAATMPYASYRPTTGLHQNRARKAVRTATAASIAQAAVAAAALTGVTGITLPPPYPSSSPSSLSDSSPHLRRTASYPSRGSPSRPLMLPGVLSYPPRQLSSQSAAAMQSLTIAPPVTYGTRTSEDGSATSSGHNTDVEEETTDERHRLISGGVGTNSSSSPSIASAPAGAYEGYQSSHVITIDPNQSPVDRSPSPDAPFAAPPPVEYAWVEFLVCDNGIGMSPTALHHIFSPYSENKLKTYRSRGGTGLGLSICKEVVTQLGGEIVATSVEGEGSIFSVRLRFQVAQPTDVIATYFQEAALPTATNTEPGASAAPAAAAYEDHHAGHSTFPRNTSEASSAPTEMATPQEEDLMVKRSLRGIGDTAVATATTESSPALTSTTPSLLAFPSPVMLPSAALLQPATISGMMTTPQLHTVASHLIAIAHTTTSAVGDAASSSSSDSSTSPPGMVGGSSSTVVADTTPFTAAPARPAVASASPLTSTDGTPTTCASSAPGVLVYPPGTPATPATPSPALAAAGVAHASPSSPPRSPHRILVVDDNEINRKLLSRIMKSLAYEVDTAEDGSLAVDAVKKNMATFTQPTDADGLAPEEFQRRQHIYEHNRYAIIIMDISMPVMDGYEATLAIRALGYTSPVIALTANAITEERSKAFESGMNEFCTKPIRKHELIALMRTFCGHEPVTQTPGHTPGTVVRQRSSPSPSMTAASAALALGIGGSLPSGALSGVSGTQPYASSTYSSASASPTGPLSPVSRTRTLPTATSHSNRASVDKFSMPPQASDASRARSFSAAPLPTSERESSHTGSKTTGRGSFTTGLTPLLMPPAALASDVFGGDADDSELKDRSDGAPVCSPPHARNATAARPIFDLLSSTNTLSPPSLRTPRTLGSSRTEIDESADANSAVASTPHQTSGGGGGGAANRPHTRTHDNHAAAPDDATMHS